MCVHSFKSSNNVVGISPWYFPIHSWDFFAMMFLGPCRYNRRDAICNIDKTHFWYKFSLIMKSMHSWALAKSPLIVLVVLELLIIHPFFILCFEFVFADISSRSILLNSPALFCHLMFLIWTLSSGFFFLNPLFFLPSFPLSCYLLDRVLLYPSSEFLPPFLPPL